MLRARGMKFKILAVIPARGGSRSIPKKNIRIICGKPMIAYAIEACLKCGKVDKTIVSTDSDEIAKISEKFGAQVIRRPEEFARDDSPTIDAVRHALQELKEKEKYEPDAVLLLQPVTPLRTVEDIENAVELFEKNKGRSVVSVSRAGKTPYVSLTIEKGLIKPFLGRDTFVNKRRQELPEAFFVNGAIYLIRVEDMLKHNNFFGESTVPYIMPAERGIDIDEETDFIIAECLMQDAAKQRGDSMEHITIAGRKIGRGCPCFIIAEAGINHNGNIELAKRLIAEAKEAGADAIKFQTHLPEKEMLKDNFSGGHIGSSLFDLLKKLELSREDHEKLRDYAREKGIIFMSTPFSREAADLLEEVGVPAYKIGSGEMTNHPLLRHIAKKNKPIILSTGMSTLGEIEEAVNFIRRINKHLAILHCTSTYPTKYEDINLGFIKKLEQAFGIPVGLSDHSEGIYTALAGVALGACIVEKHFTADRNLPGPDQKASINPAELRELVRGVRAIEKALGSEKKVIDEEVTIQGIARESVVTVADIPKGATVSKAMVWVKRPGTGIPAKDLDKVMGRKAKKGIKADTTLQWGDLE